MKIGIISLYYKSTNYGGNLQAYALTKHLNKMGYPAEQICYSLESPELFTPSFNNLNAQKKLKTIARRALNKVSSFRYLMAGKDCYQRIKRRDEKVIKFNSDKITHSSDVYFAYDFQRVAGSYDVFIAGSDQIWSNRWGFVSAYFLDAVSRPGIKMSYAASLGESNWTEDDLDVFRKYLADYTAVSVREENAVGILKKASPVPVEWVVDPTLLLTKEDWDEICAERIVREPYVFCYFLGTDLEERKLAAEYAKRKEFKLVTMPFLQKHTLFNKEFRQYESGFGDEQLYEISPEQFLSLIKYADCVFTDSFHAAVFSGLYQREYFVFGREGMEARITSLTKLYETEERFCGTPEKRTMEYILAQKQVDYSRKLESLAEMRRESKAYLARNLKNAEGKLNGI